MVIRNWLVWGVVIYVEDFFLVLVCLFFIYFFLGVGGVEGSFCFLVILSLRLDDFRFCMVFRGLLWVIEVWLRIGVIGGMGVLVFWNGGYCFEFCCIVFWLFIILKFKFFWVGFGIDCLLEGWWIGFENIIDVGKVCFFICENGLEVVGVIRELKKLCFFVLLLVLVFEENKLFRVRLLFCLDGIFWIFIFWIDLLDNMLVNFVLVGFVFGEFLFIYWFFEK